MTESDSSAHRALSVVWRYGLAVSSVAIALTVTLLLHPDKLVAPVFFLAIILSAWNGGFGPGLVAAVLTTLAITYFFLPPVCSRTFNPGEIPHLIVGVVSAWLVSSWSAMRRRGEDLLRRARDEMDAKVQERTADLRGNEQLQAEIAQRKIPRRCCRSRQWVGTRPSLGSLMTPSWARDPPAIMFWNRGAERMYDKGEVCAIPLCYRPFPRSLEEVNARLRAGAWEGELTHTTYGRASW